MKDCVGKRREVEIIHSIGISQIREIAKITIISTTLFMIS